MTNLAEQVAPALPHGFLQKLVPDGVEEFAASLGKSLTSVDREQGIGVYFLIQSGQVIYIGQSGDVHRRLKEHIAIGRIFEFAVFIECARTELDAIERTAIRHFRPRLNKVSWGAYELGEYSPRDETRQMIEKFRALARNNAINALASLLGDCGMRRDAAVLKAAQTIDPVMYEALSCYPHRVR